MRIGFGLAAGAVALTWLLATSSAAQRDTAAAPATAVPEINLQLPAEQMAPVSTPADAIAPTGGRRPTRLVEAAPLTADECTTLGGEVVSDFTGLCVSGAFCRTTDNTGKKHRVCLSKKQ